MFLYYFQVPNWTVDDVLIWVRRIGFKDYLKAFADLEVDGDILLELDELQLKEDICMSNGILRKRFIRELTQLKKKADYSTKDKHSIVSTLLSYKHNISGSFDLMEYAYALIKMDLSPDLVRRTFTEEDLDDYLREEVNIKSHIHRRQILDAIYDGNSLSPRPLKKLGHQYNSCASLISIKSHDSALTEGSFDVYISGNGEHGTHELASLIDLKLQLRGFSVYQSNFGNESSVINSSIEDLTENDDSGIESRVLMRSYSAPLERCKNFILILGAGALDDCLLRKNHERPRSHLYYEVVAALRAQRVNIVPVRLPGFTFPDECDLLPEVRAICKFNAVTWVHEYQEACVEKIERFIRGESFLKAAGSYTNLASINGARTPTMSRSRQDSGRSTPTRPGHALNGNTQLAGSTCDLLHQLSISTNNNLLLSPMEANSRIRKDSGVTESVISA